MTAEIRKKVRREAMSEDMLRVVRETQEAIRKAFSDVQPAKRKFKRT